MASMEFKNNSKSTVADAPLAAGVTTLNVAAGEGANFPSTFPFLLTIWHRGAYPNPGDDSGMEIVRCTARTTDALTIVRAQEGTADVEHTFAEHIVMLITAGHFDDSGYGIVTKLDTIETSAKDDQTGAEIKTAYEAEADTNAYDDAAVSKLAGIDTGAKDDQTGAEIKTAYEGEADTNAFTDAEKTKLGTVDTDADVTSDSPTGRCATLTVAANDSSALSKQQADYICDGTADDVEIQAAIDALPVGGGKVSTLEGKYNLTASLVLASNMIFEGQGYNTHLEMTGDFTPITVQDKNDIIIRTMRVDANGQTGYCITAVGTAPGNAKRIKVEHCWLIDAGDDGIAFGPYLEDSDILNNYIKSVVYMAGAPFNIEVQDTSQRIRVIGNICDGAYDSGGNTTGGINVHFHPGTYTICKDIFIGGNIINDTVAGIGINVNMEKGAIVNNQILGVGLKGIYVLGHGASISNNIIKNSGGYSIDVAGNYCIISNNHVHTSGSRGIYVHSCNQNSISSNSIYFSNDEGIRLHSATYCTIVGNTCIDNNQGGGWEAVDIHLTSSSNISITGNICDDTSYGLGFSSPNSSIIVMGNRFEGGIRFWDYPTSSKIWDIFVDMSMDVLAVSTIHIRSNEDLSAATPITFTLDAQPDIPRTLSWSFDTHAQITEYDMEVIGIDAKGNTVTETWDETAGWSGETSNAFGTITSIKMTSRTGTGVADTMDIGITDVLGLSNIIYETSDVFKIKKNNANATVATAQVDTTYDTYDMSVIGLSAGDDFTIWYKSNLNIIS